MLTDKCKQNPIVTAGDSDYRRVATFNPGVIFADGCFYMLERAASSLRPFICSFGLLKSADGVHFERVSDTPVLTAKSLGYPHGTVEDPRLVNIDGTFYLTYAYRPYTYNCCPTGLRVPEYTPLVGELDRGVNHTLSAIAKSSDLMSFETVSVINADAQADERDNVLFPEKINGKFALLRRPRDRHGKEHGCTGPSIWLSYSDDLREWTEPTLVAGPQYDWEGGKIGAGPPPVLTEKGWLLLYHGVDKSDVYRVGCLLLDKNDPSRVLARTKNFIMEPTEYYEKFGLVIPNVVFPSGTVLRDGLLYIYYGCCDTCIALATAKLTDLFAAMEQV